MNYRNSTFKVKPRKRLATRSPLKCHQPMKRGLKRLRAGKKVKAWEAERSILKKKFCAAGIIICELRYAGCAFDDYLGFAHADKRRKLSKEDLSVVILACNFCHDKIETDPRMKEIVLAVIAARTVQP